jgi:beta-glucosidase
MDDALAAFLATQDLRSAHPPTMPVGAFWADTTRGPADRADALIAEMTLEEKTTLLHGQGLKVSPEGNLWQVWVRGVDRLGIPDMNQGDSPALPILGPEDATQIPSLLALGASFDPANVRRAAAVLAQQVRRMGYGVWHAPTLDVTRDARHGRSHENIGEDPYLVSIIGQGYAEGVQSARVVVDLKHFGMNAAETDRHTTDYVIDHDRLVGHYLAPFRAVLANVDVSMVMTAYAKINGHYVNNVREFFDLLRTEWGFDGVVRNDAGAVHSLASLELGLDQEFRDEEFFGEVLRDAVLRGEIAEELVDSVVRRILVMMIRTGIFDDVPVPFEWQGPTEDEIRVAQEAASRCIVLLENKDALLPLDTGASSTIAVFGPTAIDDHIAGGPTRRVSGRDTFVQALADGLPAATVAHHAVLDPIALTDQLPGYDEFPAELLSYGEQPGLRAVFYDADGSVHEKRDGPRAAYHATDWALGAAHPALALPPGAVRATLSGTWTSPDGEYGLDVTTGGSVVVVIDGEQTITHDGDALIFSRTEATLQLSAGKHDITIEYTMRDESRRAFIDGVASPLKVGLKLSDGDKLPRFEQAAQLAAEADIAIVVVRDISSEGWDRMSLRLPGRQDELIAAVSAANPRTIVVLETGSAVLTPWRDDVAAIVQGWYGGSRGNSAIVDVLTGRTSPGGRLPVTFPDRDEDLPTFDQRRFPGVDEIIHVDEPETGYRYFTAESSPEPAYPFGYGLSYASLSYGPLIAPEHAVLPGDAAATGKRTDYIPVTIRVANTGDRLGRVVPQLYVRYPGSEVAKLLAFNSAELRAGESRDIDLSIAWADLAHYENGEWSIPRGSYRLLAGINARDIIEATDLEVI